MGELGRRCGEQEGVTTGSDAEAVRESLHDPEAFAALFDRHAAGVFAFLARRLERSAAENLLGEVFRIAFERRAAFDLRYESARPWLLGIAANLVAKERRRLGRSAAAMERLARRRDDAEQPFERAETGLDAQADLARVAGAVDQLDPMEREILLLFAWEELSYADIAMALDIPVGTVRSRLNRARRAIRELLERSGEVPVTTVHREDSGGGDHEG